MWRSIIPLWFVAAFVPMVASQLVRLTQTDAAAWLLCDYAGRIGALIILSAVPRARSVAFDTSRRQISMLEAATWTVGIVLLYRILDVHLRPAIDAAIPGTRLGSYPITLGLIHLFDITLGLILVVVHEEIVFRRCARQALRSRLGDGWAMVLASALLFGFYHWTTGLGNIVVASLFGVAAMLLLRRANVLWPVLIAHYLADLWSFA